MPQTILSFSVVSTLALDSLAWFILSSSHTLPTAISLFTLVNIHLHLLYVLLVFPRVLSWGYYCLPYLHHRSLTLPVYTMFISINMLIIRSFSYLYSLPIVSSEISNLAGCLSALNSWFFINGLALNSDKSDAVILGTWQHSASYSCLTSINVAGSKISLADHIKVLGVTLDKHLTFDDHVKSVSKSAFYHIQALRHIRSALTEDMAKTITCALVGAWLDYANSVLVGVMTKNVARLQHAQNAVARIVALGTSRQSASSSALLKHYHWLPFHQRIQFKIACITYKTIHTTQPAYLNSVLEHYTSADTLH